MSDIYGKGFGDDHDWERQSTNQVGFSGTKATHYECRNCHQKFSHYYGNIPGIFVALKNANVSEHCPETKEDN